MSIFNASWWAALVSGAASFAPPAWAGAAVAALFVVVCVLAFSRSGKPGTLGAWLRAAVILIGALMAWTFLELAASREQATARRALEARSAELTARALTPGSALACLDAGAGEAIEGACEKVVFARPESAAAAVAYVAARLALLADGLDFANRGGRDYENALAGWRRAIELDRYGIAAHVLATRDGCTPENCPAFALLRDASALKGNLKERAFDRYVARYAAAWADAPAAAKPSPATAAPPEPVAAAPVAPAAKAAATKFEYPSAASIPPVSIMNAEPKAPPEATAGAPEAPAAAAASPAPKLPVPPRRPQNQAATPPAR